MFLFFSLILALLGRWFLPERSIADIPFSQFTLRMLSDSLVAGCMFLGALFIFIESLKHDRIWPWRWTWPYFGNLVLKSLLVALCVYVGFWFIETRKLDGFWYFAAAVAVGVVILYVMFASEVELFEEKKGKQAKSETETN